MYPDHLHYIRNIGPLPVFWGENSDAMEVIETEGINDYYIIAQEKILVAPQANKAQTYNYRPTIFQVTKTIMGRAVTLVDTSDSGIFCAAEASAVYQMPLMPWDMVRKMDEFFREAHLKHGTEAVLVLTYTPSMYNSDNPSSGWHCVAPKQTNTAASCDYEPDSVLERKAPDDMIIGTIHSHPEMSAYFSGTDHKDQDEWDGVHITQAWRGKGPTEYHIEMILGGKSWTLRPEQVFGSPPIPNYDVTEVDTWLESVKKKTYQTTTTGHGTGTFDWQNNNPRSHGVPINQSGFTPATKVRAIKLPATAPDPRITYIIPEYPDSLAEGKPGSVACRLCEAPLLSNSISKRRCMACSGYILLESETVEELHQFRIANNYPYHISIDVEKANYPIVVWQLNDEFSDDVAKANAGTAPKA